MTKKTQKSKESNLAAAKLQVALLERPQKFEGGV